MNPCAVSRILLGVAAPTFRLAIVGRLQFFLSLTLAVYAVIHNVSWLGQFALQAERRFEVLSGYTVVTPALLLGSIVALRYVHRLTLLTAVVAYLLCSLLSALFVWGLLRATLQAARPHRRAVWALAKVHIALGSRVLIANFFCAVILALDRIVVGFSFPIRQFAIYGFIASVLGILKTLILSVAGVVFP